MTNANLAQLLAFSRFSLLVTQDKEETGNKRDEEKGTPFVGKENRLKTTLPKYSPCSILLWKIFSP